MEAGSGTGAGSAGPELPWTARSPAHPTSGRLPGPLRTLQGCAPLQYRPLQRQTQAPAAAAPLPRPGAGGRAGSRMTVRPRAPRDDREVADREMSCSPAVGHGALSGAVLRGVDHGRPVDDHGCRHRFGGVDRVVAAQARRQWKGCRVTRLSRYYHPFRGMTVRCARTRGMTGRCRICRSDHGAVVVCLVPGGVDHDDGGGVSAPLLGDVGDVGDEYVDSSWG